MIKKTKILETYIENQRNKIEKLKESFEGTKKRVIEAPTSRQSWSDTTRFQEGNLAFGLHKQIIEAELALDKLQKLKLNANNCISVGAFFVLRDVNNKEISNYFLTYEECGGDNLNIENQEIMVISVTAPLSKMLINKKKGDSINFKNKLLEIVDVK